MEIARPGPRLDMDFFQARRHEFFDALGDGAVAVFMGTPAPSSTDGRFRQSSDFYYLSGFSEPGAVAVLTTCGDAPRFILFTQARDPARERWDGARAGVEGAVGEYRADEAFSVEELAAKLVPLMEAANKVFLTPNVDSRTGRAIFEAYQEASKSSGRIGRGACELRDPSWSLARMRVRKTPDELSIMRHAAAITTDAFFQAVPGIAPDKWEYEIEAHLEQGFRGTGGEGSAYTPIVGSGENATVLHYVSNERRMAACELVLIDAAASYGHYSCDVTRTYPIGGRFTPAQARVYHIVLRAEKAVVQTVRAGSTVKELHRIGTMILIEGMIELGWLEDRPAEELFEADAHRPFFMHGIGHFLGLDTHDAGPTELDGEPYPFEPGVVFTVEPGIYVPVGIDNVGSEYHGIGIRIEDSVVVGEDGCEVLTEGIPKELREVESLTTH